MKVENLIYVYLAVCIGMIAFNIINSILSKLFDERIFIVSKGFEASILSAISTIEEHNLEYADKKYLFNKLKKIGNMRAFDIALEKEYSKNPEKVKKYLYLISDVFVLLAKEYQKKNAIESAYFPYIIKKYRILSDYRSDIIIEMLFSLLYESSIYCRENAMQAIYSTGESSYVVKALGFIDKQNIFYHEKLLTDGLLNFEGNIEKLGNDLWNEFEHFSVKMQKILLNYFRFSSGKYCEKILEIMNDKNRDDELRLSCIRYFGKYRYDKAFKFLLEYAQGINVKRWEYSAIASSVLYAYPSTETIEILKSNLHNANWYIRFNSSQSLEKMGLTYLELIDVAEGNDRYAADILRYRFDVRNIIEEEKESKTVC